jgi:hypothetical protein
MLKNSWRTKYSFRGARTPSEAANYARMAAMRDVPNASVQVMSVKENRTGFTVEVLRRRSNND